MSQIENLLHGGAVAGGVATLTGNTGGPVGPDGLNNINVLGGTGITVVGVPGTNTLTISNNAMVQGTGTTIGAVTNNVITFPMGAVAGVYSIDGRIAGFNTTDVAGGGYFFTAAARTTGVAGVEIANQFSNDLEEPNMVAADVDIVIAGNNIIVQVLGIALKTINWVAEFEYNFVS